ncbi:hypothetical protein G6F43_011873 [Rhizopus delemar]|nr:hypothetical protein G6F43_011873 [Rhizopus delemar]
MPYSLSQESWKEMHCWLQRAAHLNGLPIILSQQLKEPDVEIFDDASDTGQGVTSCHTKTADYRKEEEKDLSINVRELKTIAFALQHHAREFEGVLIKIFSNNITTLKYANKSGRTSIRGYKNWFGSSRNSRKVQSLGTVSTHSRCLRNESEHMSTSVLESEPRPTSRSDLCMEPTVEGNRPIFAPILETGTKSITENEDRQHQESCVDRTKLAKPVLVTDGSKTKLNPANELQDLQTMILDCMTIIRCQINSTHARITICNGVGGLHGV